MAGVIKSTLVSPVHLRWGQLPRYASHKWRHLIHKQLANLIAGILLHKTQCLTSLVFLLAFVAMAHVVFEAAGKRMPEHSQFLTSQFWVAARHWPYQSATPSHSQQSTEGYPLTDVLVSCVASHIQGPSSCHTEERHGSCWPFWLSRPDSHGDWGQPWRQVLWAAMQKHRPSGLVASSWVLQLDSFNSDAWKLQLSALSICSIRADCCSWDHLQRWNRWQQFSGCSKTAQWHTLWRNMTIGCTRPIRHGGFLCSK